MSFSIPKCVVPLIETTTYFRCYLDLKPLTMLIQINFTAFTFISMIESNYTNNNVGCF